MEGEAKGAGKTIRRLKPVVAVAAFLPAAVILVEGVTGRLGANPIADGLNSLGLWTLILLLSSLACTPLKILLGWNWPLQFRKTLGLAAFSYACLHLLTYVVLDQGLDWPELWKDVTKRKFMTVGFAAFLALVPLAVTSTRKMLKRLGFARWKRLHRLVYVAAVLGVIHFIWRVKADTREPLTYGAVLLVLLGIRLVPLLRSRASRSA